MKKILVSAILGLAAIASVQAQSAIQLYSDGSLQNIVFGAGSGGTLGQSISSGYTIGYYYAVGDVTAAFNSSFGATAQNGSNGGTLASSGLILGTGTGSTVGSEGTSEYYSIPSSVLASAPATGSPTVTVVIVAYNGTSYEASTGVGQSRGHSAAFTMTAVSSPGFALHTGDFGAGFAVVGVPEPSTFALAGLGLASLLIFRRRK